jgi:hypothetical protein
MKFRPPRVEALVAPYMAKKALSDPRRYDIFHPSAWGSCLRKIAYQHYNDHFHFYEQQPHELNMRFERIFDNGHAIHERWQSYLDNAGFLRGLWKCPVPSCGIVYGSGEPLGIFNPVRAGGFRCECGNEKFLSYEELTVASEAQYNFKGAVDAVVDVRGTQHATDSDMDVFVVDFKSMKHDYFLDLVHAKWEHVVQVHIYMWLLGLKAAVVVYECKNTQNLKEMFVPRDDALVERIKGEAEWLVKVIKRGKLPRRPKGFFKSKFPCMFCEFAGRCYA